MAVRPAAAAPAVAGPTLTAEPPTGVPGDVVTLTLTGCADGEAGFIGYQFQDTDTIETIVLTTSEPEPGVFTAPLTLGGKDVHAFGACGSPQAPTAGTSLLIDVEVHRVELQGDGFPIGSFVPVLAWALGTDCPVGGDAEVTFVVDGGAKTVVNATPDANGSWQAKAPANEKGEGVTVTATCGGIDYGQALWNGGAGPTMTTVPHPTDPAPTPSAAPPSAPPAEPIPGGATFTG
ncbi:MAG: hypothetical protein JWM89_1053 [Acidimicrobiales bacterium]|nr:hypothetical protein [Acidimicrobiales bacterium]